MLAISRKLTALTIIVRHSELTWLETLNQPAVAGGSIKPRVERSETLGTWKARIFQARETGDRGLSEGSAARFAGW